MASSCFVCMETSGELFQVCPCSYVHKACFTDVISKVPSHATHCAVCKYKYNLKPKWRGCNCVLDVCVVLLVCLTAVAFTANMYFLGFLVGDLDVEAHWEVFFAAFSTLCSCMPIVGIVQLVATRRCCRCGLHTTNATFDMQNAQISDDEPLKFSTCCITCRRGVFTGRLLLV